MKLAEAFVFSMLISLMHGMIIFIGIPAMAYVLAGIEKFDFYFLMIPLMMFVVYAVIQVLLSTSHFLQALHWRAAGSLDPGSARILFGLLRTEAILYLVVFGIALLLTGEIAAIAGIALVSIPYIICCTASVFIFRYLLRKMPKPAAAAEDTPGAQEAVPYHEELKQE